MGSLWLVLMYTILAPQLLRCRGRSAVTVFRCHLQRWALLARRQLSLVILPKLQAQSSRSADWFLLAACQLTDDWIDRLLHLAQWMVKTLASQRELRALVLAQQQA